MALGLCCPRALYLLTPLLDASRNDEPSQVVAHPKSQHTNNEEEGITVHASDLHEEASNDGHEAGKVERHQCKTPARAGMTKRRRIRIKQPQAPSLADGLLLFITCTRSRGSWERSGCLQAQHGSYHGWAIRTGQVLLHWCWQRSRPWHLHVSRTL